MNFPIDVFTWWGEYSSTITYEYGAVVNYSGTNYVSITDLNEGNTPSSSPSQWASLAAPNPLGTGPSGPQELTFVNGPVTLSDSEESVTLISADIPQGVYKIKATVGNITVALAGSGTVSILFPLYLVDAAKGVYEGVLYFGSSSGLSLTSNQGPGTSNSIVLVATPIVTP